MSYMELKLLEAAERGDAQEVEYCVASDIDPNIQNNAGATPLYLASDLGKVSVITYLVKQKKVDVNLKANNGKSPLFVAVSKGSLDIIKQLLTRDDIDLNTQDKHSTTALMVAVRTRPEIFDLLLKHPNIDINQQKTDGSTALMYAITVGNTRAALSLLANKDIDLDLTNKRGKTAYDLANEKGLTSVKLAFKPSTRRTTSRNASVNFDVGLRKSLAREDNISVDNPDNLKVKKAPSRNERNNGSSPDTDGSEIESLLSKLGMEDYVEAFAQRGITDISEAAKLTAPELKDMGVLKFSERAALMKALTETSSAKSKKQIILMYADTSPSFEPAKAISTLKMNYKIVDGTKMKLKEATKLLEENSILVQILSSEFFQPSNLCFRVGVLAFAYKQNVSVIPAVVEEESNPLHPTVFFKKLKDTFEKLTKEDFEKLSELDITQEHIFAASEKISKSHVSEMKLFSVLDQKLKE